MKKIIFTKLLMLLTISGIYAQQFGEIDPNFNIALGVGANGNVSCAATQPDGKTIIVGSFTKYGTVDKNRICRLNLDGTVDNSFNSGTGCDALVTDVKIQTDGKILILGAFSSYNNIACNRIARLNPDGTLDNSFTAGTIANNGFSFSLSVMAVQPDGKLLIGGIFSTYNGVNVKNIALLNIDGSLDTTFVTTIGQFQLIELIVVLPTSKILVIGQSTVSSQTGTTRITRLNVDGSFDSTYNGSVTGRINDVQMQADGKMLIGGSFSNYQLTPRNNIARLNINGTLDTTFDPGTSTDNTVENIKLLSNGKIIISGNFTSFNGVAKSSLAAINTDGSLDSTFDVGNNANFILGAGENANRIIAKIAEKPDGKIIIVGKFISINGIPRGRLAQLNADGTFDTTFFNPSGFGSGSNNSIVSATLQTDGKIVVVGSFTSYNSISKVATFRLNTDGTLDVPFTPVTVSSGAGAAVEYCIVVQPDGKILVAGRHLDNNFVLRGRLIRVNAEFGSLDQTFVPGSSSNTNGDVFTIALQTDGKILIGGVFSTYNGVTRNGIARLNADGTIDSTFNPLLGANNGVNTIVVQPDGKILIGGNFTTYNGISRNRVARLNSDGTLDTNFVIGTGANNEVNAIALKTDGKILIGGFFTSYNGIVKRSFARLNFDGSLDGTFGSGIGPNSGVRTIKIKLDEKIIIGGDFTSYDGTSKNRIAFLNFDGTLDTSHNIGTGANNSVRDIIIQPDGKVVIVGDFDTFNSTPAGRITRLLSNNTILTRKEFTYNQLTVYPNPSSGIFNIQTKNLIENATITVADLNGRIVYQAKSENADNKSLNLNNLSNGIYILNIANGNVKYAQKLVKQ